jgi:hypothetical protein
MIAIILSLFPGISQFAQAKSCGGSFFGFPTWYKYLPDASSCSPRLTGINDIWLIMLAIAEILLRVAVIVAIAFVLIGGFKYITSQGNPDKTSQAKKTVVDGLIGVVIAIVATAVISFIASRFQG